jgi:hypothetical protein
MCAGKSQLDKGELISTRKKELISELDSFAASIMDIILVASPPKRPTAPALVQHVESLMKDVAGPNANISTAELHLHVTQKHEQELAAKDEQHKRQLAAKDEELEDLRRRLAAAQQTNATPKRPRSATRIDEAPAAHDSKSE